MTIATIETTKMVVTTAIMKIKKMNEKTHTHGHARTRTPHRQTVSQTGRDGSQRQTDRERTMKVFNAQNGRLNWQEQEHCPCVIYNA